MSQMLAKKVKEMIIMTNKTKHPIMTNEAIRERIHFDLSVGSESD